MIANNYIMCILSFVWILSSRMSPSSGNHDAKRLYDDLLRKKSYNKLVRPVANYSKSLTIYLGLRLAQLIDVDERNQIISLNVWLLQKWNDSNLRWNPEEYGGVKELFVPSESIWIPDILMYNNADGDFVVTLMTKAALSYTGEIIWEPPVIYKSQCDIDVEFFPFDQQLCKLKFGSWTYDGFQVDLRHMVHEDFINREVVNITIDEAVDFSNYYRHVEWDVMEAPARKNKIYYPCCPEPYPDITFNFTIRRRTMFYTVNLIIPCLSLNMLTILGFYLPCDCGEKISLCISILLSLSIFQLLLFDIIPPTSVTIPLIGKYLLFTCIVVSLSVFCSVIVLNLNYRSCPAQPMSDCTRKIFLHLIPTILLMRRPESDFTMDSEIDWSAAQSDLSNYVNPYKRKFKRVSFAQIKAPTHRESNRCRRNISESFIPEDETGDDDDVYCHKCARKSVCHNLPVTVQKGMDGIMFYAKHLQEDDTLTRVKEEWKYMALVVDRILLWIYISVCVIGAVSIMLNAPVLYDDRTPITRPEKQIKTHRTLF